MLDDLRNRTFVLDACSLRYEGERRRSRTPVQENLTIPVISNDDQADPDWLEDAIKDFDEPSQDEIDLCWGSLGISILMFV